MRRLVSSFAVVAILVQGPSVATAKQDNAAKAARSMPQSALGLCAPLAPLPRLAPESQQGQGQARPRPVPVAATAKVGMTGTPPPVAAPPPPAEPVAETASRADMRDAAPAPGGPAIVDVTTGETIDPGDGSARSTATVWPGPPHRRPPRPQSGLLTAGEHDDLLNPELYANYVRRANLGQEIRALPVLDTARVLTVTVRDSAGRPVPFAPVEVACADDNRLALRTLADGSVAFFPDLDRLGHKVRIRAGGQGWREVTIAPGRGGQRVDFTAGQQAPAARKLDLMLVIDTTGSMGDEIRYLQSELAAILDALRARHPGLDLRVGFVFYRDTGDEYVTMTVPMTGDFSAAQGTLRQQYASGGGDYPEAMDQAMVRAASQQWRPDAVKTLLLVADAPPHDDGFGTTWLAARHLRANRDQIVPVAASGVADKAEYAMRAMAALTQSRYIFLTDDSGIGNPHAAPAVDCYRVTRLDALLRRVIDSQLSGRRLEPEPQEIIRTVGQYDNGRCIIPRGWGQQQ